MLGCQYNVRAIFPLWTDLFNISEGGPDTISARTHLSNVCDKLGVSGNPSNLQPPDLTRQGARAYQILPY